MVEQGTTCDTCARLPEALRPSLGETLINLAIDASISRFDKDVAEACKTKAFAPPGGSLFNPTSDDTTPCDTEPKRGMEP